MAAPTDLYTDTMDVYTPSYTASNSGGAKRTTTLKASSKACRVQTESAAGRTINAGAGMNVIYRIFTDYSGVVNGDELRIDASVYRVTGTPIYRRAIGDMDAYYVVEAMEVIN